MRFLKPTTLTRLLVAAGVLFGGGATGPTFGHSHPDGDTHHAHVDWDAGHHHDDAHHEHTTAVVESDHDHDADLSVAVAGGLEFHLHCVLFGIPVSLPVPAEPDSDHETQSPLALAYVLPSPMLGVRSAQSVGERIVCPESLGIALSLRAELVPTGHCSAHTSADISLVPPCALKAQSGVLRC
jgi:hypothetical protein